MKAYLQTLAWVLLAMSPVMLMQAHGKPDKPPPMKKKGKEQYPDLNYRSNWGEMKIDRNSGEIIIFDHPVWEAEAQFVTPTKVYVMWTLKQNGRLAPGVYDLQTDGTLTGAWGYDEDVEVDQKTWTITGRVMGDRIQPIK
jgi:hypothetical protein